MTDLADLSAAALLAAYRARSLSPVEVTRAVLDRMEAWEPTLHALWLIDAEGALAAAHESERRWRDGVAGALDGVPVTIKENIATRGVPVPVGTAATKLVPAADDAPAAARVREAGGVILGKTTMPDYGMLSSGLSSFHALARNPWDVSRNPGGSSAGAGAAAACGYGPLHLGTDIGGSVRLPAGWCGVVGHKPSFGRVPVDPPYPARVVGPMTRTVTDSALLMAVISGPDARDHMSLPPADIAWTALDIDLKGLRLGLMMDAGAGFPVEPEVRAVIERAAAAFGAAGAEVAPMPPFLSQDMLDGLDRFWRARAWADIGALSAERQAAILPFIHAWAEGGAGLSGEEVYRGFECTLRMRSAARAACAPFDFILSPVAPMAAFAAELPAPSNDPDNPFAHIAFTVGYSMSEQPAVSVNAGFTADGLPVGLQIAGQRFDDLGVLRLARAWEALRPVQPPWPRFG